VPCSPPSRRTCTSCARCSARGSSTRRARGHLRALQRAGAARRDTGARSGGTAAPGAVRAAPGRARAARRRHGHRRRRHGRSERCPRGGRDGVPPGGAGAAAARADRRHRRGAAPRAVRAHRGGPTPRSSAHSRTPAATGRPRRDTPPWGRRCTRRARASRRARPPRCRSAHTRHARVDGGRRHEPAAPHGRDGRAGGALRAGARRLRRDGHGRAAVCVSTRGIDYEGGPPPAASLRALESELPLLSLIPGPPPPVTARGPYSRACPPFRSSTAAPSWAR